MKAILLGDAMIGGAGFQRAWEKHMARYGSDLVVNDWEKDWGQLQYRRLEVEKRGPEIEIVDETILKDGQDAQALMGLFVPVSSKVMDAMPKLRIVGVSRAGLENSMWRRPPGAVSWCSTYRGATPTRFPTSRWG